MASCSFPSETLPQLVVIYLCGYLFTVCCPLPISFVFHYAQGPGLRISVNICRHELYVEDTSACAAVALAPHPPLTYFCLRCISHQMLKVTGFMYALFSSPYIFHMYKSFGDLSNVFEIGNHTTIDTAHNRGFLQPLLAQ